MAGTLIRTVKGDVAVERLKVGDLALNTAGKACPIIWLGQRTIDCRHTDAPLATFPVRVAAGAFGESLPYADLWLSPGHAVAITVLDEVLVRIGDLVNGATIAQVALDEVTYFHVELDQHDTIYANGLPSESYLDVGNRAFFAGITASPDRAPTTADGCRPLVMDATTIEAVRSCLRSRALTIGWWIDSHPALDLHILVDGVVVEPTLAGDHACFVVPPRAQEVWLVSRTFVPHHFSERADKRELGIQVRDIVIASPSNPGRAVDLRSPSIDAGFHQLEQIGTEMWRWTTGRTKLPLAWWNGCQEPSVLKIGYSSAAMNQWIAPDEQSAASCCEQPSQDRHPSRKAA